MDTNGEVRAGRGDPELGPHSTPAPNLLCASPQASSPEQDPGGVVGGAPPGWGHAEGIPAVSIPAAPSQGCPRPGVMLGGGIWLGGLDASTLLLLRESPSAFVTQRNKAPEGFSPVLLLPWGLQDVGWCCILAVPGLIPFLFAELPALAAASQSSEQTARMVEGLGKHAWYFPSFPPPPPYQLFPSPQILPAWDLRFACLQEGLHNRLLLSSVFVGGGQEWEDPVCTPGSLQSPNPLYALMAGLQGAPSPPQLPWGWLSQGGSQASLAFSPPCTPYKPPAMPQQDVAPAGCCSSNPWPQSPPYGPSPAAPLGFFNPQVHPVHMNPQFLSYAHIQPQG